MNALLRRSGIVAALLVAAFCIMHGKTISAGELTGARNLSEKVLLFEDFTSEAMLELVRSVNLRAELDDDGDVRIRTDKGKNIYINRYVKSQEIGFVSFFIFKNKYESTERYSFFARLCRVIPEYAYLKLDDDDDIVMSRDIPMEASGITAGHFLESLGKYMQNVRKLEDIEEEIDIFR